jgi:hypothetical protein
MMFCGSVVAEQYLCTGDLATGFLFDKKSGQWIASQFDVKGYKYIVAPFDEDGYKYRVTEVGQELALVNCKHDFDQFGYLGCEKLWVDFRFNKNNGRYLKTNAIGYFNVLPDINGTTDATSHTPMIEIGKCTPIKSE